MAGLKRTFKILTFAVCISGFAAMMLTGKLGLFEHLAIFLAVIVGWFWGESLSKIPKATGVATAAIIIILILSILSFFTLSRSFVTVTISFLIYVQVVRVLFLSQMRHHLQVFLISLASLLAATILTFSPLFFLSFVVYLFLATGAMITYNFIENIQSNDKLSKESDNESGSESNSKSNEEYFSNNDHPSLTIKSPPIFAITISSASFVLLSAIVIFFFFPRISAGYLPSELVEPVRVSGFSKNVELGEVGNLKLSTKVFMRVLIENEEAEKIGNENVYFRGTAFDIFDGRYWEKADSRQSTLKKAGVSFLTNKNLSGTTINQEFFMEPNDSKVLFSINEPTSFEGPFVYLTTDRYDTVETKRYFTDKLRYKVTSVITSPDRDIPPLTPKEMKLYLNLPDKLDDRIKPLVNELKVDVDSDIIVAERIRGYLLENLSYDLNPGDVGDDPLADFLFVNKQGYCEHFATAMVIMLRCAGIRSRLVTGFLAGNYNEYGSFYTVRASDAHAWVEAYFDGVGWVTLDPTPPAGLVLPMDVSIISGFVENLKMKWNIYIVNFEMKDQMEMLNEVRDVSMKGGDTISDLRKKANGWVLRLKEGGKVIVIPILGIILIVVLFLIAYVIKSLFFSRGSFQKGGSEGASRAYFKALSLFTKKGVTRKKSMTPGEFSKNVNERFPNIKDDFSSLSRAYLTERFGGSPPNEKLIEEAFASFLTIKEKLKRGV